MNEFTWTFASVEEIDAFLMFVAKCMPKDREAVALKDPRNGLTVIVNSYVLWQMAKAFQFGWIAGQALQSEDHEACMLSTSVKPLNGRIRIAADAVWELGKEIHAKPMDLGHRIKALASELHQVAREIETP